MEMLVAIEKVHTKKYQVSIDIDEADLKQWAIDRYGQPENYDSDNSEELTLNEDGDEVPRTAPLDDWYLDYVCEYLQEQDADSLLNDNCHDHSNYETLNEEYSLVGFGGK